MKNTSRTERTKETRNEEKSINETISVEQKESRYDVKQWLCTDGYFYLILILGMTQAFIYLDLVKIRLVNARTAHQMKQSPL